MIWNRYNEWSVFPPPPDLSSPELGSVEECGPDTCKSG